MGFFLYLQIDKLAKLLQREINARKDLQRVAGLLNWYQRFIPRLSLEIYFITELLKKSKAKDKVVFTTKMKEKILHLVSIITIESKLDCSDYSKKIYIRMRRLRYRN